MPIDQTIPDVNEVIARVKADEPLRRLVGLPLQRDEVLVAEVEAVAGGDSAAMYGGWR
jgi:hypothetical protein